MIFLFFFEHKKRSRHEPQCKQNQAKGNNERNQEVLVSLYSRQAQALGEAKYHYAHYYQTQPNRQGSLKCSLQVTRLGSDPLGCMVIVGYFLHRVSASFPLLLTIHGSEHLYVVEEDIGKDEDVHRCADKCGK